MSAGRCAERSIGNDEPVYGTASTVRAFLLLEHPGPWGVNALTDARLPEEVRRWLAGTPHGHHVRALLIRRNGRSKPTRPRVFAAYAGTEDPWMETTQLRDYRQVLDLDVAALGRGRSPGLDRATEPVFGVCTHGRHDVCCAERGRPLAAALARAFPDHTWEVSHIGGDRFAANVLVLPEGLYYGRVDPADARALGQAHLDGLLDLPHLRGWCRYGFAVQAADYYLRSHLHEPRRDAVRLLESTGSDGCTEAVFEAHAQRWRVLIRAGQSGPGQLTCRATRDQPYPVYTLESVEPVLPADHEGINRA